MGLRCSLFGHTFSETDTRRDREVRGDEVVTVVKTVERCGNCGAERVVSENKEVVSVVDADDIEEIEDGDAETDGTEPDAEAGVTAEADAETEVAAETETETERGSEETAPTGGDEARESAAVADADADPDAETDDSVTAPDLDPEADPDEEDVEFITETDGSLGGADEVDVDPDEEAPEGGIGGMAARSGAYGDPDGERDPVPDTGDEASDEDAEILGGEEPRGERAPGQWPEDPDATDEPWEPGELGGGPGTEPEPNEEVAEPAPVDPSPPPSSGGAETGGDSLHCPACGHTVSTEGSYRAGDACPECHADYLEAPSE